MLNDFKYYRLKKMQYLAQKLYCARDDQMESHISFKLICLKWHDDVMKVIK